MVTVPKFRKTYNSRLRRHTLHKISQYKKGRDRPTASGNRNFRIKKRGFGGTKRPILKRKAKITKKVMLKLTCIKSGDTRFWKYGRCKSFKFEQKKKPEL